MLPSSPASQRRPRVGFIIEQALGHVTYGRNLQAAFADDHRLTPVWLPVPYAGSGLLDRLPLTGRNWTLRGSLRGHLLLRRTGGARCFDALFYHTQTVALFSPLAGRAVPVVLSLDATPVNFDTVGAHYQHRADPASQAETVKRSLYRRVFAGASALTTWSQWAKDSLREDYGVDPDRVTVIPPGVDLSLFSFVERSLVTPQERRPRILFVGGDFERKGGPLLLACMRAGLAHQCELHVVTGGAVPETPGVFVYRDLGPNDPRLVELYRSADIFALPTYADCLAVVLGEAMATGLPIVTTSVGAQPEAVHDGGSGFIIPPGEEQALGRALNRLIGDPGLRLAMGRRGRAIAESRFDARLNADRLVDVVLGGIDRWHSGRAGQRMQAGAAAGGLPPN